MALTLYKDYHESLLFHIEVLSGVHGESVKKSTKHNT